MTATSLGRVVTLVRRGDRPACVMLPGAGGGISPYAGLAMRVGRERNVHVIRAAGLMPDEEPERTIEAMAESALDAIDAAGIVPHVVLGWSMGGAVGWELCARLSERSELPDLVLVDSSPFPREPSVAADARLCDRVVQMLGAQAAPETLDRVRRTVDAQICAVAAYRTRRTYGGRVQLLMCSDGEIADRDESVQRWRSLAPELRVAQLAAGHFDVFDPAVLPELGDQIATFLGTSRDLTASPRR